MLSPKVNVSSNNGLSGAFPPCFVHDSKVLGLMYTGVPPLSIFTSSLWQLNPKSDNYASPMKDNSIIRKIPL